MTVGRVGLFLDRPVPRKRSDRAVVAGKPYWLCIKAENIINWYVEPRDSSPAELVHVVIRETSVGREDLTRTVTERYRELFLTDEGIYQVRLHEKVDENWIAGDWFVPKRNGMAMNYIPFVVVNSANTDVEVQQPPLLDLVNVNLGHYRNSADLEHGLFLTALPTPWASGVPEDAKLKIGPSICWKLAENGRAGMMEFSGAGLKAIREEMTAKQERMAVLGARMLVEERKSGETATAAKMRRSGESAVLSTVASTLSQGLTMMLKWHVWWEAAVAMETVEAIVRLSRDYENIKATPEEVKTMLLVWQSEGGSFDWFYSQLESGGWARPGVSAEDERMTIINEGGGDPAAEEIEGGDDEA